ncbi:MAG: repeat-like protein, partial [Verrucomicrobiales bacterium]|nr:repeat-like protein [Verrucomicrobiales bacterium]
SDQGTVGIWNIETGDRISPKLLHSGWVESVHFNNDGTLLLTTSDDGTAKIWDLTGEVDSKPPLHLKTALAGFPAHLFGFTSELSADKEHLIIGGDRASVINTRSFEIETTTPENGPGHFAVAIDSSGQQWAAGLGPVEPVPGQTNDATLWRREAGGVRTIILKHPDQVGYLKFIKGDSQLLTLDYNRTLRRWQTSDGALIEKKIIGDGLTGLLHVSPDNRTVALCKLGEQTTVFDFLRDDQPRVIAPAALQSVCVAFSPDGARLATAGGDQYGHIWEIPSGRELTAPFKHGGTVQWIEWSPDGKQLLTTGLSPEIRIWDSNTGQLLVQNSAFSTKASLEAAHFSPNGRLVVSRNNDRSARVLDVATGDALTPEIRHDGEIHAALHLSDNRVVTISDPDVIRAWALTPSTLPTTFLSAYAQVVSGRKLNDRGRGVPLAPAESAERMRVLHKAHGDFFAESKERIRRFHRSQIVPPFTLLELYSASHHLKELTDLDPQNPELVRLNQFLDSFRIPPRDEKLDSSMVDLSRYYNASLGISWNLWVGHDLAELKRGKQVLNGIAFDIRGIVEVAPREDAQAAERIFFPSAVSEIRVHKKAKRLHFLHATEGVSVPIGVRVGSYFIRYSTGRTEEVPLIYGEGLRDWFTQPGEPEEATHAEIAWTGQNQISRLLRRSIHLFRLPWDNPVPNEEIATIDLVASNSRAHPFLIAITAEETAR